jgi:hypothetical protein
MNRWTRIAAALVLSLVACGVVQHAALAGMGEFDRGWLYTGEALVQLFTPLAVAVAVVTAVFALVIHFGPHAGRLALVLLALMAAAGIAIYIAGVNSRSPGIAGNLGYFLATLVVFCYLAPCAIAVLIHWLLLRKS